MTIEGFTDDDYEKYVEKAQDICPNCHSSNWDFLDTNYHDNRITTTCECANCETIWQVTHILVELKRL